jgi:hypothetical protein
LWDLMRRDFFTLLSSALSWPPLAALRSSQAIT